jgi:hypothetical protein
MTVNLAGALAIYYAGVTSGKVKKFKHFKHDFLTKLLKSFCKLQGTSYICSAGFITRIASTLRFMDRGQEVPVWDGPYISTQTARVEVAELGPSTCMSMKILKRMTPKGVRPEEYRWIDAQGQPYWTGDQPDLYRTFVGSEPVPAADIPQFCRQYWGGAGPIGGLPARIVEALEAAGGAGPVGQGGAPPVGQGGAPPVGQGGAPPVGQGGDVEVGDEDQGSPVGPEDAERPPRQQRRVTAVPRIAPADYVRLVESLGEVNLLLFQFIISVIIIVIIIVVSNA